MKASIGEKTGEDPNDYAQIRNAQLRLCEDRNDCTMIASFYGFKDKDFMVDAYHYTQLGYNVIGKEAGERAGESQ